MSNPNGQRQPMDLPVKSEGEDANDCFGTDEDFLAELNSQRQEEQTVDPRTFTYNSSHAINGAYGAPTYRPAGAQFTYPVSGPESVAIVPQYHTSMGPNTTWQGLQHLAATEQEQYQASSSESPDSSYGHHSNGFLFDTNLYLDGRNPPSAYVPHLYGPAAYQDSQPYVPQTFCAGDLPLLSSERNQQPVSETLDTKASDDDDEEEEKEDDVDWDDADSKSGSDESSTGSAVAGDKIGWTKPQFGPTRIFSRLYDKEGRDVGIEMESWWDKVLGFMEDPPRHIQYRRNFMITTRVRYMLVYQRCPPEPEDQLYLGHPETGERMIVQTLGVRLRGVIDDEDGAFAEVCHLTPQRNPIGPPVFKSLRPSNGEELSDPILWGPSTGHFDKERVKRQVASFDHYQFRKATPNNGARRKQQALHRVVHDLIAIVSTPDDPNQEEIRVASRTSSALETRGRCPKSFEPFDKSNPHHNRRKPQTADDRRQKKLKTRAANRKKASGMVSRADSRAAPRPERTRSQRRYLRAIAAQPPAPSTVPTLSHSDSTRTNTVGRASPSPPIGTQDGSYMPDRSQAVLGLANTGRLSRYLGQTHLLDEDNRDDLPRYASADHENRHVGRNNRSPANRVDARLYSLEEWQANPFSGLYPPRK